METSESGPTPPPDAAAALAEAEAFRTRLACALVLPSFFYATIGGAVAVQIAVTACTIADDRGWALAIRPGGVAFLVLVAVIQLVRFRRLNGV